MQSIGESAVLLTFRVEGYWLASVHGFLIGPWRLDSGHGVKTGLPCCLETVPLRVIYVHPSLLRGEKTCLFRVCQIWINK